MKEALQFVVPEPYRAWCHLCKETDEHGNDGKGFPSLDELHEHVVQAHGLRRAA